MYPEVFQEVLRHYSFRKGNRMWKNMRDTLVMLPWSVTAIRTLTGMSGKPGRDPNFRWLTGGVNILYLRNWRDAIRRSTLSKCLRWIVRRVVFQWKRLGGDDPGDR
ncbi:hypothetical protein SQ11_03660 [Nitrosospira sp. NpAV]|nr:hypothetical protein SQ11_03660 [Nitrosospira sp. NpAV]